MSVVVCYHCGQHPVRWRLVDDDEDGEEYAFCDICVLATDLLAGAEEEAP